VHTQGTLMPSGQRRQKRRRSAGDYRPPPKRGDDQSSGPDGRDRPPVRPRRPGQPERPPAPWGHFPLVELVVLLSIAMLLAGFFVQGNRGVTLIGAGIALGSLAGFELAIREHLAGFRSHTTVLAGSLAVLVLGLGFFFLPTGWGRPASVIGAVVVFGVAFFLLREVFKRRSGGLGFKLK
jgi:hypothetical protein